MIPLVFTEDANGKFSHEGMRQPSLIDFFKLVAHTGVTLAVPAGAKHVLFAPATAVDFFVKYTPDVMTSAVYFATSADVASATRTAGCGFEQIAGLTHTLRTLKSVSGLGLISADGGDLTLAWFG